MPALRANPTGGQVVSGHASINTLPGTVTINQVSNTAIINWQDFSIATGELTRFQVPTSASATLNRVTGGNVSTIYGTLQSNGQVYLLNPNGILVGSSGVINTAGFVASTLNFSDTQFNAQGNLLFSGSSTAGVNNQGTIQASLGNVYLIATQVANSGTITAPNGNVGLAAGSQVLMQAVGDQHLFVQAGSAVASQGTGVNNTGTIQSATAELKAAGGNAYALAINNSGNIAATGITEINGQVYLTADGGDITNSGKISAQNSNGGGGTVVVNAHSSTGATTGTLLNSGSITAQGTAPGTTGGTVELLGDQVGVIDKGSVDVSGQAGGGTALIGGDSHGANPAVPDADQTYVGPDAQIFADALESGNGGKIVLWGNETTQAYGRLSVRGGAQSGNGGSVETSAPTLDIQTAPDLSAPNGQGGSWLLDPSDIVINNTVTTTGGFSAPFTISSGNTYDLNQSDLLTALESGGGTSITLDANSGTGTGSGTGGSGTIVWSQTGTNPFNISLTSAATLTLQANGGVTLNNVTINSTGSADLSLEILSSAPSAVNTSTIHLNTGVFAADSTSFNLSGTLSAADVIINAPAITLNGATVTTTDFNPENGFSGGLWLGYAIGSVFTAGQINIDNSLINCAGAQIGNTTSDSSQGSQVTIDDSTINLTVNTGPPNSTYLQITGYTFVVGSPGVSITNGSSITAGGTANGGQVQIQGTGQVSAGQNAIGVLINDSTLTDGSSGTPGSIYFDVDGNSDAGSTAAAPGTFGAASAYGVEVTGGSTLTSYSTNGFSVSGFAYADDVNQAVGLLINGASTVHMINAHGRFDGDVDAELTGGSTETGAAYTAAGVDLNDASFTVTGVSAPKDTGLYVAGGINHTVTAENNANSALAPSDYGVDIVDTQISASGDNQALSTPVVILGDAAGAVSISSQVATSIGISISGGSTLSNSGDGAFVLAGGSDLQSASPSSGANVVADGVSITGTAGTPETILATGGGSIGIAGGGGTVASGSGGSAVGVNLQYANLTTNSGIIALIAAAGNGLPTADLIGLDLSHANIETGMSGGTPITNGGTVPPIIMIYATGSSAELVPNGSGGSTLTFELGSSAGFAIDEDANSSLVTPNLVMGDYYNLFTTYLPASTVASSPTLTAFNNFLTGTSSLATSISSQGVVINPAGIISLTSPLNQITNLDSALDGSGGFDLYDSTSLTVDPIGGSNNQYFGQIDEAGTGPVTITVAPNMNLTLTDVSPLTGTEPAPPEGIDAVIATTGAAGTITLVTSGTGDLINQAGATALSVAGGAKYILYAGSPSQFTPDGITPVNTLYSTTSPGAASATGNTIAYASAAAPSGIDVLSGTDYSDSGGVNEASGVTIDLLYDGTMVTSATTTSMGAFTFNVSSADLTGGILLTDATNKGNTYYQAASPLSTITGIDIWGSTLRVMATAVSNSALGRVAGLLSGVGINYTLSSSNLATNTGINMTVLSNTAYTLDGNITVAGALNTSTASSFTTSLGSVTLTGASMALGGSLTSTGTVNFDSAGTIYDSGSVQVGNFFLLGGTWNQVVGQNGLAALPTFSVTGNFALDTGTTFERFAGGNGSLGNPYEIADVYGLQGMASPTGNLLSDDAELVGNINATGTSAWNSGAGFVPIGNVTTAYTGIFDGQNFTINGIFIDLPAGTNVGLFGEISGATIKNVGATNVQVTGANNGIGGLVGSTYSTSMVDNDYSTGTVSGGSGNTYLGGLVGFNSGNSTISASSSSAMVFAASGSYYAAGLVGYNYYASINDSYSTGAISGDRSVGGLVGGFYGGTVSGDHSSGSVSGNQQVGGLVGILGPGAIDLSYSTGAVTGGTGSLYLGGLVGNNNNGGTIDDSYSTGTVTGGTGSSYLGGLVGNNAAAGSISTSYSTGAVNSGSGSTDVGGLVGNNDASTINIAYSTGAVTVGSASTNIGGLVGANTTGAAVSNAFSTGTVTAGAGSSAIGGLVGYNDPSSINDTYTLSMVNGGTGSTDVGALVGNNAGTITDSFIDTDITGMTLQIGSDPTNTTPGVLEATGSDLESQSYILTNAPTWDFVNTWTTYNASNTPQLIPLPEVILNVPIILNTTSPLQPIHDTLFNTPPIQMPGPVPNPKTGAKVTGGASGVATTEDQKADQHLAQRLAQRLGAARAERMLEIIKQDLKDGSTVNTNTLAEKWVANTGLSKLVTVDGTAELFEGLALPVGNAASFFDRTGFGITPATLEDLSRAAFGGSPVTAGWNLKKNAPH